eukprot:10324042-Prorocentrum_lima.AAC.1
MTSSLVGSEMCIRDSAQNSVGMHLAMWLRTESVRLEMHQTSKRKEVLYCLLYTSDAADDM